MISPDPFMYNIQYIEKIQVGEKISACVSNIARQNTKIPLILGTSDYTI
jgi:hypothetical protein